MEKGTIHIVQGGLWGSEGKGQVTALVAQEKNLSHAVRTGSINAGHNVHIVDQYGNMQKIALQQIPTAVVHPDINLYIGAAAYISEPILRKEIELIKLLTGEDIRHRLYVDSRCGVVSDGDAATSKAADRHTLMGATGKGCSEAIVTKMRLRGTSEEHLAINNEDIKHHCLNFVDTAHLLYEVLNNGEDIILEGTQGTLLDFNTGEYPFVTSRGTLPAHWLAEAGLPMPSATNGFKTNIIIVLRTMPIRVAGFSGSMGNKEVSWHQFLQRLHEFSPESVDFGMIDLQNYQTARINTLKQGYPDVITSIGMDACLNPRKLSPSIAKDDLSVRDFLSNFEMEALITFSSHYSESFSRLAPYIEKTTVTLKPRRLADMDFDWLKRGIELSGCDEIWLGFLNYLDPTLAEEQDSTKLALMIADMAGNFYDKESDDELGKFISDLDSLVGIGKVSHVSTGPLPKHHIKIIHGAF
jgi:adenylosuccinate synthase